jgi:hypothetical protein
LKTYIVAGQKQKDTLTRKIHKFFCYGLKNAQNTKLDQFSDKAYFIQLIIGTLIYALSFALVFVLLWNNYDAYKVNLVWGLIIIFSIIAITICYFVLYFYNFKKEKISFKTLVCLYSLKLFLKGARLALPIILLLCHSTIDWLNLFIMVFSIIAIVYAGLAFIIELVRYLKFVIHKGKDKSVSSSFGLLQKYQNKYSSLRKDIEKEKK